MSLTPALHTDIYSRILEFISSPRDLLAVSLSNKELFALARPELVYRSIYCRLDNNAVWEHLISNPAKTARVRELWIQDESQYDEERLLFEEMQALRSDGSIGEREESAGIDDESNGASEEDIERSEKLLIQAVRRMVNLESFVWDRSVPIVNVGETDSTGRSTYDEDIWTTLRDHTQLRRLKVVDFGRTDEAPYARPIFDESSISTLSNLTHVDLEVDYFAVFLEDVDTVNGQEGGGDGGGTWLNPSKINVHRLKDLLHGCPHLQILSLAIPDHHAGWTATGYPFTDMTSIFSDAHWKCLTSLHLQDVIIDPDADSDSMLSFLYRHPTLRTLEAFLSLSDGDRLAWPFSLRPQSIDSHRIETESDRFLPNMETVSLPAETLRSLVNFVEYPWPVRCLGIIEPSDWDPDVDGGHAVAMQGQRNFRFTEMPNLREITIRQVYSFAQLEQLAKVTPLLETLHIFDHHIKEVRYDPMPHTLWLPYLSRWPRLKSVRGVEFRILSTVKPSPELSNEESEILKAIKDACPNLERLSWYERYGMVGIVEVDGKVVVVL